MNDPIYCIMPILAHPEYTRAAIADCLAQSIPTRLLLINQGVDDDFRDELEKIAEEYPDRVLLWSHQPPLPSLAATWNRALQFVWETGGTEALVVNNDVRLQPRTLEGLLGALNVGGVDHDGNRITRNLFVSAVGVTPTDFSPDARGPMYWYDEAKRAVVEKGGPDFSCFLISRACHARFQFDEAFIPAHTEDLDFHRRLMLAGEGKRIFSVNLPFLHYGATTLKSVDAETRQRIERDTAQIARVYYRRKWGGDCNRETFVLPFRQTEERDVTTPALQRLVQEGQEEFLPRVDPQWLSGQGNSNPALEDIRGDESH